MLVAMKILFSLFWNSSTETRAAERKRNNEDIKNQNKWQNLTIIDHSPNFWFNSKMIFTTENLKETIISPIAVPAIGNQPIFRTSFDAPSEHSNRVSTKRLSFGVLINTRLIADKIFVDSECRLNWAIFEDLLLNVILIALHRIARLAEMLISLEVSLIKGICALVHALWCLTSTRAWHSCSIHMMLTRLNGIWKAALRWVENSTWYDSLSHPVAPCRPRKASITAKSTSVTAFNKMNWRDMNMHAAVNTVTIAHRFCCAKGLWFTTTKGRGGDTK